MNHPDLNALADYWLGAPVDDAFEEHLFECAECSRALEWIVSFAKSVQAVVRRGNLGWVLTPEFVERLAQEGLRIRTYAPENGGSVQCTITSKDDLLMGRLRADLSGVERLDAVMFNQDGSMRVRLQDLAFRPIDGREIVFNQPVDMARALDTDRLVIKLMAVSAASERTVGEYTFNHSRTRE